MLLLLLLLLGLVRRSSKSALFDGRKDAFLVEAHTARAGPGSVALDLNGAEERGKVGDRESEGRSKKVWTFFLAREWQSIDMVRYKWKGKECVSRERDGRKRRDIEAPHIERHGRRPMSHTQRTRTRPTTISFLLSPSHPSTFLVAPHAGHPLYFTNCSPDDRPPGSNSA